MNTPIDSNDDTAEVQAVMGDYFAALLRESAEAPAQPAVVEALTLHAAATVVEQAVAEATSLPIESTVDHSEATAPQVCDAALSAHDMPTVAETQTAAHDAEQPDAIPTYQLIRIGGLTLGIPTHAIAKIVTAPSHWIPQSDARGWVLGGYSGETGTYTVVDTAAVLVPGSTLQATAVGSNAVLLAGQRWALACDGIGEQITPDPAQVNWRGAQGKRPWLAGTVRTPTCALLDIPELLRLLES